MPAERTGVSVEAANKACVLGACFLCGLTGCSCESSRAWEVVWCEIAVRCAVVAVGLQQQRFVTRVSVGLVGLAKTREVQRSRNRQKKTEEQRRAKAQRERDERWRRRWWWEVALDYE